MSDVPADVTGSRYDSPHRRNRYVPNMRSTTCCVTGCYAPAALLFIVSAAGAFASSRFPVLTNFSTGRADSIELSDEPPLDPIFWSVYKVGWLSGGGRPITMGPMTLRSKLELGRRKFGDLDCTLIVPAGGRKPRFCVVLCHGFGAPGTDLVPLGQELAGMNPDQVDEIAYLFPEAPLELGGYGFAGRAWWMVDVERFQRAMGDARAMAELRAEVPPGMPESSLALRGCLEEAERQLSVPLSRTLLGGFSQGSMVATDVALRLSSPPAALCVFSGHLLAEAEWRRLAKMRGSLGVLLTHG
jgi:phospholipase/carboxylesterase